MVNREVVGSNPDTSFKNKTLQRLSYQVHPGVERLDGGRVRIEPDETVDQVGAERGVDALGGELPVVRPVVGPRAPVADHLLVVSGNTVFAMVGQLVSLSVCEGEEARRR